MNSFTQKKLRITLVLDPANTSAKFPGTNDNTLVIENLRATVNVQTVPGVATNAEVHIFGMRREDMNALTVAFFNLPVIAHNGILVEANDGSGYVEVFSGSIIEAAPEYRAMPNVFFVIQGVIGYQYQISSNPPLSYTGDTSVASIAETIAGTMGLAFENSGVTAQLRAPYLPGSTWDQLRRLCGAAGCNFLVNNGVLAIYPLRGPRTRPSLVLSPSSGLVGYPVLNQFGVITTSLFNPAFSAGDPVEIRDSTVPNANGSWVAQTVNHMLETTPGGAWFSVAQCYPAQTVAA